MRCVCPVVPCRAVHEQLSTVVRKAAEAAVGTESLLLVLGALQVRAAVRGAIPVVL